MNAAKPAHLEGLRVQEDGLAYQIAHLPDLRNGPAGPTLRWAGLAVDRVLRQIEDGNLDPASERFEDELTYLITGFPSPFGAVPVSLQWAGLVAQLVAGTLGTEPTTECWDCGRSDGGCDREGLPPM